VQVPAYGPRAVAHTALRPDMPGAAGRTTAPGFRARGSRSHRVALAPPAAAQGGGGAGGGGGGAIPAAPAACPAPSVGGGYSRVPRTVAGRQRVQRWRSPYRATTLRRRCVITESHGTGPIETAVRPGLGRRRLGTAPGAPAAAGRMGRRLCARLCCPRPLGV
jgi:hypothetical protein